MSYPHVKVIRNNAWRFFSSVPPVPGWLATAALEPVQAERVKKGLRSFF